MKLFFHFPPNNDMMDTGSIKRKGKMPLFWHFMAAEKTENWMLHRKVSTTMNFIVPAAAGLIDYYRGHKLVLINKSVTPMDNRADLVISGPIGEVLGDAVGV